MDTIGGSGVPELEPHSCVRLVEFALKHRAFSPSDACKASGLKDEDFQFIAPSIFILNQKQESGDLLRRGDTQEWRLRPEAYFGYLQFVSYRHAVESAKQAYRLSVLSVVVALISAVLALCAFR